MTLTHWLHELLSELDRGRPAIRAVLVRAEGSTPREMGAHMMIYHDQFTGTIGGGTLEHEVIKAARQLMNAPRENYRSRRQYPLGPTLGQCCGGFVEVMFEHIIPEDQDHWKMFAGSPYIFHPNDAGKFPSAVSSETNKHGLTLSMGDAHTPLYLYGAGHVGRALMGVTHGLPLERYWVDTHASRFPSDMPAGITPIVAANPAQIAQYAKQDAIHVVMSYSHQIDLDICLAILKRNQFSKLGLIGSTTKKARFLKALSKAGIDDASCVRLICPIGLPEIGGKDPARVALSVAAQLSEWTRSDAVNQDELVHHQFDIA